MWLGMSQLIKGVNQLQLIFMLRAAAIVIQCALILFVNLVLNYQLPWLPLLFVISAEILFTGASFYYFRKNHSPDKSAIFVQILADVLFLSFLLFFSGGATNAFVSLLLIPIAIAAVTLERVLILVVALVAIASYSVLLWQLPMSVMHGNMEGHFIGMWINFLFSTTVVALVVGKMSRSINQRELAIAKYREELLKQEQVISLGVASAQVTHQIATPLATIQLLTEELQEESDNEALQVISKELARCKNSIESFRKMTFDIKDQTISLVDCCDIIGQIKDHIALNHPDIIVQDRSSYCLSNENKVAIKADASLLPALLNLVNNAVRATRVNNSNQIALNNCIENDMWQLEIRDYGNGFTLSKLSELGVKPVDSKQGFGMAVFLSYATLERLGGTLKLTNHQDGGALVTVSLPNESIEGGS